MSTPVWQGVWDNLVTALALIDGTADYTYTLESENIYTDMVNLMQLPGTGPFVVIGPSDGHGRKWLPTMRMRETVIFGLEARVDAPGTTADRKGEAFTLFAKDIERALTRDITRGGLAARTLLRPPVGPFMGFGAQQQVLFSQEIEIDLVRTYGAV